MRCLQSGYIYHYAFAMIIGVLVLLDADLPSPDLAHASASILLNLAIWVPIVAGVAVLATGSDRNAGSGALARAGRRAARASLVTLPLYARFRPARPAASSSSSSGPGSRRFNVNYHLGIDGISLLLILLNSFTTVLVVIAGWEVIRERVAQYMAAFLILSGLMNGVFCALDALLFYVFFEATLIPMFIIIGVWGGPNRVYAAVKFFLYTLLGSLLTLVALIYLYNVSGGSFSLLDFYQLPLAFDAPGADLPRVHAWPSRSRCRCGRCTPGCRTRTSRRRPAARWCWRRSC